MKGEGYWIIFVGAGSRIKALRDRPRTRVQVNAAVSIVGAGLVPALC